MENTHYNFEKEYTKKDPWNYNNSLKDCVRRSIYVSQLQRAFDIKKISRVFDAGCGEGYLTKDLVNHYPNVNVDATDISQNAVEIAKELNFSKSINYSALDLTEYTPTPNAYDLIICTEVLLYFTPKEVDQTVSKFYNSLTEGGVLLISLMTDHKEKDNGKIELRKIPVEEITGVLKQNNFHVTTVLPSLILNKKLPHKIYWKLASMLFPKNKPQTIINYLRDITLSYPLENCHKVSILAVKQPMANA